LALTEKGSGSNVEDWSTKRLEHREIDQFRRFRAHQRRHIVDAGCSLLEQPLLFRGHGSLDDIGDPSLAIQDQRRRQTRQTKRAWVPDMNHLVRFHRVLAKPELNVRSSFSGSNNQARSIPPPKRFTQTPVERQTASARRTRW
jgi:hypothetical protein